MATRRKIGVATISTEAARRTQHWTKQLATGYKFQVFTWAKTDAPQEFSDNEDEVEESLAPLPDEAEVGEGDEEMDQDETISVVPPASQPDLTEEVAATQDDLASKPPSPSPQPQLSMSLQTSSELSIDHPGDTLDASLNPLDVDMDVGVVGLGEKDGIELDISSLGPDGLQLESAHDLSQLEGADVLIGGSMMDHSGDPFAEPVNQ